MQFVNMSMEIANSFYNAYNQYMTRSFQCQAIVLSIKECGENNSNVTLLTPEQGILYATLYGGPKSRLRSLVSLWNCGNIWFYENPEKSQTKITDFEVKSFHNSFGENLFKMYAASLASELAIKTRCGGSNGECFTIVKGFFDGMELCNEEQSRLGLLRFLWRFLELLGLMPDVHCCCHCGKEFTNISFADEMISHYNNIENSFICPECTAENHKSDFPVSIKGVRYLAAITFLKPSESRKIQIDKNCYEQLKQLIFFLIENAVSQKLNTIETGLGIL